MLESDAELDDFSDYEGVVIVNATACAYGGALTILKQFIRHAENDGDNRYLLFVPKNNEFVNRGNILFVSIDRKSWLRRILWDAYGLKKWLKEKKIKYKKLISLQNTSVNVDVEQVVYLHNPFPFFDIHWRFYRRDEVLFFLYRHIYPIFIFLFFKCGDKVVVQSEWMKNSLCEKFNIDKNLVFISTPEVNLNKKILDARNSEESIDTDWLKLLYPATPLIYKNHDLLLNAIKEINDDHCDVKIRLSVTFNKGEYHKFDKKVQEFGVSENVDYVGYLSYQNMISRYIKSDIVVFPSYVETLGLPLIEAAALGKLILASDTLFAHELLDGYDNVKFIDYRNSGLWAEEIIRVVERQGSKRKCESFAYRSKCTWKDFFTLINRPEPDTETVSPSQSPRR